MSKGVLLRIKMSERSPMHEPFIATFLQPATHYNRIFRETQARKKLIHDYCNTLMIIMMIMMMILRTIMTHSEI